MGGNMVHPDEEDVHCPGICVDLPRPVTQPSLLAKTYKSEIPSILDPQKKK
jgi:hypothetical protein